MRTPQTALSPSADRLLFPADKFSAEVDALIAGLAAAAAATTTLAAAAADSLAAAAAVLQQLRHQK